MGAAHCETAACTKLQASDDTAGNAARRPLPAKGGAGARSILYNARCRNRRLPELSCVGVDARPEASPSRPTGKRSEGWTGVWSVTRVAAPAWLLAGTSQAIGKRLHGRVVSPGVTPKFIPKRTSELTGGRGLSPDDAVRLEFGDARGSDHRLGGSLPSRWPDI